MKRLREWFAHTAGILLFICINIPHVAVAITLFQHVTLWAFLVMLLVPGVGDVMAIWTLIRIQCWWPFVFYAVSLALWLVAGVAGKALEGKGMKKIRNELCYKSWVVTPMRWHYFLTAVSIPLSILSNLFRFPEFMDGLTYTRGSAVEWIGQVEMTIVVVLLCLCVAAEVGMIRKAWFGPCLFLAGLGVNAAHGILGIAAGLIYHSLDNTPVYLGNLIYTGIMFTVCLVYYRKRRALFSPQPEDGSAGQKEEAAAVAAHSEQDGSFYYTALPEPALEAVDPDGGETAAVVQERKVYGPLDGPEKRPRRGAPVWLVVTLGALCLALAVGCGVLGWMNAKTARAQETLSAEVSQLLEQVESLERDGKTYENRITAYENMVSRLEEENKDLREKYEEADSERTDYRLMVGVVSDNDETYFHTPGCFMIKNSDNLYVFSTNYCFSLGMKPCLWCFGEDMTDFLTQFYG